MDVREMSFEEFEQNVGKNEGIVLLGAGGNPQEWIQGVSNIFEDEKLAQSSDPEELFSEAILLTTSGGRTDLALTFNPEYSEFDMSRMAMWRIAFGDCSWTSDYLVNYKEQHESNYSEDGWKTYSQY